MCPSDTKIGVRVTQGLSRVLATMGKLEELFLDLDRNKIGGRGAQALAKGLGAMGAWRQ